MKREELKQYTSDEIEEIDDAILEASEDGIIKMTRVYIASEADAVMDAMELRWRKFPDEKPSEEGYYIICGSSGFRSSDKWTYCKDRQKMDFSFYSYGVAYWMPFPPPPTTEESSATEKENR